MILTQGQEEGLATLRRFRADPTARVMVLTGFAGTGKSTLLGHVAQEAGAVTVVTPTGKAALRVEEATGLPARTIHRWRFRPDQDEETGDVRFVPKALPEFQVDAGRLLVLDEASMVGPDLWRQVLEVLRETGMQALLVGDPFQLGPVERDLDVSWSALQVQTPYRAHLGEVVRQAAGSPVLAAATAVRAAASPAEARAALQRLPRVLSVEVGWEKVGGGPTLVHTNAYRHELNRRARLVRGLDGDPQAGEPLLVLRNDYGIDRYNGEVLVLDGWDEPPGHEVAVTDRKTRESLYVRFGAARAEGVSFLLCPEEVAGKTAGKVDHFWLSKASFRQWSERSVHVDEQGHYRGPRLLAASYGYALTTHKSQGSQWDSVLIALERTVRLDREDGRRLLYTMLTRAVSSVYWTS